MKKIVLKLMDFGMDFNYEHRGSDGEEIISFELAVKIKIRQGKVTFEHEGEYEEFDENKKAVDYLVLRLHDISIEATT